MSDRPVTATNTTGTFVIRLADLEAGPLRLQLPITSGWLEQALEGTDARPWLAQDGGEDEGVLSVQISTSGRNVLVRGVVRAAVTLPCARTLDPANYRLESEVFLMLSPASQPAQASQLGHGGHGAGGRPRGARDERAPKERPGRGGSKHEAPAEAQRPGRGQKAQAPTAAGGKTSSKKKAEWSEDPELTQEDAALDTFSGEQIVLDVFVREFILLELPMFPVREDLRSESFEASSAHPSGAEATGDSPEGERPLDPRLSPLAELKARLDQRARPEKKE